MVRSSGQPRLITSPAKPSVSIVASSPHTGSDTAESAGLLAIAVQRERLLAQRLTDEVDEHSPIGGNYPFAVSVEDADDVRVDAELAPVACRQRLAEPLRLIVDRARPGRAAIAAIALRLRMHGGIAVDFAGRGEEEPRPISPRALQQDWGPTVLTRAVASNLR